MPQEPRFTGTGHHVRGDVDGPLKESTMSDNHTTDSGDEEVGANPRHETDETTSSDAGLTGAEGVEAQPEITHDEDDD